MSEHTKEPWVLFEDKSFGVDLYIKANADSVPFIAEILTGTSDYDSNFDIERSTMYANAKRIVACVNACAGYKTEHLESLVLCGDTVLNRIVNNVEELNIADKLNEELLKHLKKLVDMNCPLTGNPSYEQLIEFWQYEEKEGRGIARDMINAILAIMKA